MKAIVYHSYGSAEVLKLEELDKPVPNDDQVLIKVHAAALNPLDWRMMKGVPFIFRKMMKMRTSKPPASGVKHSATHECQRQAINISAHTAA